MKYGLLLGTPYPCLIYPVLGIWGGNVGLEFFPIAFLIFSMLQHSAPTSTYLPPTYLYHLITDCRYAKNQNF